MTRAGVADRSTIGAAEAAYVAAYVRTCVLLELQVRKLSQGRESVRS